MSDLIDTQLTPITFQPLDHLVTLPIVNIYVCHFHPNINFFLLHFWIITSNGSNQVFRRLRSCTIPSRMARGRLRWNITMINDVFTLKLLINYWHLYISSWNKFMTMMTKKQQRGEQRCAKMATTTKTRTILHFLCKFYWCFRFDGLYMMLCNKKELW